MIQVKEVPLNVLLNYKRIKDKRREGKNKKRKIRTQ
jgi:hypothetical protein